jgi:hypothetical protein
MIFTHFLFYYINIIKYKSTKETENILGQPQHPLLHFQADELEHGSDVLMPQAGARWLQYSSSVHFPRSTSAETSEEDLEPDQTGEAIMKGQYR